MVVMNRKRGNVHNISEHITLPKSPCIHQYGSSPNSVIWGFYREKKKKITSASLTMIKPLTAVDHNKLWKILKNMGIPDHLTCLLRNPCAGQEATVRMGHGTKDWFQTGKRVHQGCIFSPYLLNLYRVHHVKCQAG